jgi:hypothetical protein
MNYASVKVEIRLGFSALNKGVFDRRVGSAAASAIHGRLLELRSGYTYTNYKIK